MHKWRNFKDRLKSLRRFPLCKTHTAAATGWVTAAVLFLRFQLMVRPFRVHLSGSGNPGYGRMMALTTAATPNSVHTAPITIIIVALPVRLPSAMFVGSDD